MKIFCDEINCASFAGGFFCVRIAYEKIQGEMNHAAKIFSENFFRLGDVLCHFAFGVGGDAVDGRSEYRRGIGHAFYNRLVGAPQKIAAVRFKHFGSACGLSRLPNFYRGDVVGAVEQFPRSRRRSAQIFPADFRDDVHKKARTTLRRFNRVACRIFNQRRGRHLSIRLQGRAARVRLQSYADVLRVVHAHAVAAFDLYGAT